MTAPITDPSSHIENETWAASRSDPITADVAASHQPATAHIDTPSAPTRVALERTGVVLYRLGVMATAALYLVSITGVISTVPKTDGAEYSGLAIASILGVLYSVIAAFTLAFVRAVREGN